MNPILHFCSFMLDKTEIVSCGEQDNWNLIIFQKWFSMSTLQKLGQLSLALLVSQHCHEDGFCLFVCLLVYMNLSIVPHCPKVCIYLCNSLIRLETISVIKDRELRHWEYKDGLVWPNVEICKTELVYPCFYPRKKNRYF